MTEIRVHHPEDPLCQHHLASPLLDPARYRGPHCRACNPGKVPWSALGGLPHPYQHPEAYLDAPPTKTRARAAGEIVGGYLARFTLLALLAAALNGLGVPVPAVAALLAGTALTAGAITYTRAHRKN